MNCEYCGCLLPDEYHPNCKQCGGPRKAAKDRTNLGNALGPVNLDEIARHAAEAWDPADNLFCEGAPLGGVTYEYWGGKQYWRGEAQTIENPLEHPHSRCIDGDGYVWKGEYVEEGMAPGPIGRIWRLKGR